MRGGPGVFANRLEGHNSVKRRAFNFFVAAGALGGASSVLAAGFDIEGKYQRIRPQQPTETPEGVIEVVDIFGYRCPHCFRFLPVMERFEQEKPEDVAIRHMPVIFRKSWEAPARAYYTAKLLGVVEQVHRPIFEALHMHNRPMDNVEDWRSLFVAHGVDAADFDKTFGSFGVDSLIRKSVVMQERYGITGTPSVVVNGKYRVPAGLAGGYENMIEITRGLIELERAAA